MAIDILSAFEQEPPQPDFIWPGFRAGRVGALVSPGGVGKSFFALQAAIAVAGGADILELEPKHVGRVVYLAAEDTEEDIIYRLHEIGKQMKNKEQRQIVAENLTIEPMTSLQFNIMREDHTRKIIEIYGDSRLIILDTISCFHTLDENNNSEMTRLINRLKYIAAKTGATILFLHHTNKMAALAGLTDQQQAARGASAIVDGVRWCGFLRKMTKEEAKQYSESMFGNELIGEEQRDRYLCFGVSKNNLAPTTQERWFKREKGGVLMPIKLIPITNDKKGGTNYGTYSRI